MDFDRIFSFKSAVVASLTFGHLILLVGKTVEMFQP